MRRYRSGLLLVGGVGPSVRRRPIIIGYWQAAETVRSRSGLPSAASTRSMGWPIVSIPPATAPSCRNDRRGRRSDHDDPAERAHTGAGKRPEPPWRHTGLDIVATGIDQMFRISEHSRFPRCGRVSAARAVCDGQERDGAALRQLFLSRAAGFGAPGTRRCCFCRMPMSEERAACDASRSEAALAFAPVPRP